MIIDAHCHIWDEGWLPAWAWVYINGAQAPRYGRTVEEMKKYRKESWDPSGDIMIKNMDSMGVDKAVICVLDWGLAVLGEDAKLSIEEINHLHYKLVKRHPDRLYFAVGVDPRRKNAREIVGTGLKEWGAKSLKLYPGTGWYPNDRIAYPLYEKCIEFGVPVNFHTGPIGGPLRGKYMQPIHFDDVAADFPELTIHCSHTGHGFFMEMLAIARARPNIVCDLAGWLPWIISGAVVPFYQTWRYIMNMIGADRLMFASDNTALIDDMEFRLWLKAVKTIPEEAKAAGVSFTPQEMTKFFSGTCMRILHLEDK